MNARHSCPPATRGHSTGATALVSVADWTAGYEAGWTAGYLAARTVLDEAAGYLARTLRPSAAIQVAEHRRAGASSSTWRTPAERDDYRHKVYASWGLSAPEGHADSTAPTDERSTRDERDSR